MGIFKFGTVPKRGNKRRNKLYPFELHCAKKAHEEEEIANHENENKNSVIEEGDEYFENENNENGKSYEKNVASEIEASEIEENYKNDREVLFDSEDEEHEEHLNYADEMNEDVENPKRVLEFDDDFEDADVDLHVQITRTLYNSGYAEYLSSNVGGLSKPAAIKTSIRRIAQFLIQSFNRHKGSMLKVILQRVIKWSVQVFTEEYLLLSFYVEFLESIKGLKPNTVLTYLDALDHFSKWVCQLSIYSKKLYRDKKRSLDGFQSLVKRHRQALKKAVKREKSSYSCTSMARQVQNFKLPKDGFEGLQKIVADCFDWASEFTNVSSNFKIDSVIYNDYVGFLVASLYVFAPQGRIGGIQCLVSKDYEDFIKMGHAMSSSFKTKAKYELQPVLSNEKLNELITTYMTKFRPIAVKNARDAAPRGKPIQTPEEFWLTFDGKHDERLGRRLTQFFVKKGHYHITTTSIRSLLETTAHKAMISGGISPEHREAISNVGGHSSQVVNDYYLKHDRNSDAQQAKQAFNIMAPTSDSPVDEQEDVFPGHDDCEEPDVGSQHPDYLTTKSKASWTEKEIMYTGTWIRERQKKSPNKLQPVFVELHAHILQDPEVRKIFHRYHVCSPSRLQHGKKAYELRFGKISQTLKGDPDYTPGMRGSDV